MKRRPGAMIIGLAPGEKPGAASIPFASTVAAPTATRPRTAILSPRAAFVFRARAFRGGGRGRGGPLAL
jgi:hypothetical protein